MSLFNNMLASLIKSINNRWNSYPLRTIMLLALLLRMASAIFSEGYGMHDDHFLVIETPWSWTKGYDYDRWLPKSLGEDPKPTGHNFFYAGINYLLFQAMDGIGIENPKTEMFILRLLLAFLSLLTVYYSYKITEKLTDEKMAKIVGIFNACLWFMPFFVVRNLVEVIAIPFLMAGVWLYIKEDYEVTASMKRMKLVFFAGFVLAMAISIRYQVGIFLVGMGIIMLIQKRWRDIVVFGTGVLISLFVTQGIVDIIIWGKPFVEMIGYVEYNISHRHGYGNANNYFLYVQVLFAMLVPPASVYIFFGFFRVWKKYLILFFPVFLFFLFHTYYPNRQERFIVTIVPLLITLGLIGWYDFVDKSKFWTKYLKLHKASWIFFWVLNIILILPMSLSSTKKSRINAMHYFYPIKDKVESILVDDTGREKYMWMPVFYAGKPIQIYVMAKENPEASGYFSKPSGYVSYINTIRIFEVNEDVDNPEYVIFVEDIDLDERVDRVKQTFPNLKFEAHIVPSFVDRIMKKANPVNENEEFFIYRVN